MESNMSASAMFLHLQGCDEAVVWAKGKTVREAWNTCSRADWMMWLCGRMAGIGTWPKKSELISFCESFSYKGSSILEHTLASAIHSPEGDPDLAGHLSMFIFCLAKKRKMEDKVGLEGELAALADTVREKFHVEDM